MVLKFDFTQDATRASILHQVRVHLDGAALSTLDEAVATLNVADKHHSNLAEIKATIVALNASEKVRADMIAIYEILTNAEATVHQTTPDKAHFHEVGRAAGIRNVAEICLAIEALAPERIMATAVQAGCGTVECAHGTMPIPAPATAVILDSGIPTCEDRLEGERCTPTSAAMIKHFVDEFEGKHAHRTYFQGPVPEHEHHHHHEHTHSSYGRASSASGELEARPYKRESHVALEARPYKISRC